MSSQDIARTQNLPPHGCVKGPLDTVVTPIDAILGDIPSTYTSTLSSAFTDSRYLLNIIRTASIFVFIGVLSLACNLLSVYCSRTLERSLLIAIADVES